MSGRALVRAAVLAGALLSGTAFAQNAWTINYESGAAVMGEISVVYFTVANGPGSTQRLDAVSLQLPFAGGSSNDYDIEGGIAPPGWQVSTLDKQNKVVTFVAQGGCPRGLSAGQSDRFGIKLVGKAASTDIAGESLVSNKTEARNSCANFTFPAYTGNATWTRVSLAAQLTALPRTLDTPQQVTVRLTVTNRSTKTQNNIVPFQPQLIPGSTAQFGLASGPSPASLSLGPDQTGIFTWTFIANQRGIAAFRTSAQTAGATSEVAESMEINVGFFPGMVSLNPFEFGFGSQITNGGTVTLSLTVANNTTDQFTNVIPSPPGFSGTATATLVSGPTPASVASLSPSGATRFQWTYKINGSPGDTYKFTAQAFATRGGFTVGTDPVGSATGYIVLHTATPEPRALLTGSTNRTIAYTIANGGTLPITKVTLIAPDASYFSVSGTPFAADTSGWSTSTSSNPKAYIWTAPTGQNIPVGGSKTFRLTYSSVGPVTTTTTFTHRFSLTQTDNTTVRTEGGVTLFVNRVLPEVEAVGVVSSQNRNTLLWNNPADHDGVLVLRSTGAPPNTAPVLGTRYNVGATLGNATVVYIDSESFTSSITDSGLTNGTKYFYKVYNHDEYFVYSAGNVPTSSGIFGIPTDRVLPNPLWCYSFGFPSTLQPVTDLGQTVFTASNAGTVTANVISTNPSADGSERWRPVKLNGAVQGRFLSTTLAGRSGKYIVVGDQAGYAYAIDSASGSIAWKGFGGVRLGDAIQAQPAIQYNNPGSTVPAASVAAFQAAHPGRDLVFFATRNLLATNNRVYALSSVDGNAVWTYPSAGTLDIVNGGMMVDYENNRLYVAARSNGGTQASVHVINTLNGQGVATFDLGASDYPINYDAASKQAYVTTNDGKVHGIDLATLTVKWSHSVGGMTSYAFPVGNGFIASHSNGTLQRYAVNPTTHALSAVWASPPSVPNPSGIRIEYATQKLYVGDSNGKLHQINVATGVDEKQLTLSTTGLGMPTIDFSMNPKRLHVGTLDGRICAVEIPF